MPTTEARERIVYCPHCGHPMSKVRVVKAARAEGYAAGLAAAREAVVPDMRRARHALKGARGMAFDAEDAFLDAEFAIAIDGLDAAEARLDALAVDPSGSSSGAESDPRSEEQG